MVEDPRVVESPALVATGSPKYCNVNPYSTADGTSALLPRLGVQQSFVLLDKVVIFPTSFKEWAILVDRIHNFLMRFFASVKFVQRFKASDFHFTKLVFRNVLLCRRFPQAF